MICALLPGSSDHRRTETLHMGGCFLCLLWQFFLSTASLSSCRYSKRLLPSCRPCFLLGQICPCYVSRSTSATHNKVELRDTILVLLPFKQHIVSVQYAMTPLSYLPSWLLGLKHVQHSWWALIACSVVLQLLSAECWCSHGN